MARRYLMVILAFTWAGSPVGAHAGQADLTRHLGEYARTTGPPDVFRARFFATSGPAHLLATSSEALTGTSIVINGRLIEGAVGADALHSVVPISLLDGADNRIEVTLAGPPGAALSVRIRQHVDVDFQFTSYTTYSGNTASFEKSRAFYARLGWTTAMGGFPKTNTLEMGRALGVDRPYTMVDAALLILTYGNSPSWIDLIEWVDPRQDEPPYANLNHLGMAHAAYATTDIDADYAHLKSQGVEFLSAPVGEPGKRFDRFVFLKDPDGTFIQLVEGVGEPAPRPCDSQQDAACPVTHLTRTRHINVNVSDFEGAREYFRMLGYSRSRPLPSSTTLEEARAMGFDAPAAFVGADINVPASVLPEGDPNVAIRLMQWLAPYDDAPPYPLPITHIGIHRLVLGSEAGDNMMATKVGTLRSQGVKMVSPGAPCCSGNDSPGGIVLWYGPDGVFLETGGAFKPPAS